MHATSRIHLISRRQEIKAEEHKLKVAAKYSVTTVKQWRKWRKFSTDKRDRREKAQHLHARKKQLDRDEKQASPSGARPAAGLADGSADAEHAVYMPTGRLGAGANAFANIALSATQEQQVAKVQAAARGHLQRKEDKEVDKMESALVHIDAAMQGKRERKEVAAKAVASKEAAEAGGGKWLPPNTGAALVGLRWRAVGTRPGVDDNGNVLKAENEISCNKLEDCLAAGQTEFDQVQYDQLDVPAGVHEGSFIRVEGTYYRPDPQGLVDDPDLVARLSDPILAEAADEEEQGFFWSAEAWLDGMSLGSVLSKAIMSRLPAVAKATTPAVRHRIELMFLQVCVLLPDIRAFHTHLHTFAHIRTHSHTPSRARDHVPPAHRQEGEHQRRLNGGCQSDDCRPKDDSSPVAERGPRTAGV